MTLGPYVVDRNMGHESEKSHVSRQQADPHEHHDHDRRTGNSRTARQDPRGLHVEL